MEATSASYLDIADDLREQIEQGRYPPGSRIPSYSQLAATYGVHISTVQRGIGVLRYGGILVGRQGRGVFVAG